MERLSPILIPQSTDEGAKEQKRAILASLKWGGGGGGGKGGAAHICPRL